MLFRSRHTGLEGHRDQLLTQADDVDAPDWPPETAQHSAHRESGGDELGRARSQGHDKSPGGTEHQTGNEGEWNAVTTSHGCGDHRPQRGSRPGRRGEQAVFHRRELQHAQEIEQFRNELGDQ